MTPLKKIVIAVVMFRIAITQPGNLYADGMSFKSRDGSQYRTLEEKSQVAAILHEKNRQKMMVALNLELGEDEEALWILPVPGDPSKTLVDITDAFPKLHGVNPIRKASESITGLFLLCGLTQIYTIPLALLTPFGTLGSSKGFDGFNYLEINKFGLKAVLHKPHDLQSFGGYIRESSPAFDETLLASFEPYVKEGFSFVLVKIDSRKKLLEEFPDLDKDRKWVGKKFPCLYVEFDCENPFYPMRATSGYGDLKIPVTVYVAGSVKLKCDETLASMVKSSVYAQSEDTEDKSNLKFPVGDHGRIIYTRFSIKEKAESFVDDFQFIPVDGPNLGNAFFVQNQSKHWGKWWLGLMVVLSYLSGGIVGYFFFSKQWNRYSLIGLANVFTILPLAALNVFFNHSNWKTQPVFTGFVTAFSLTFVLLLFLTRALVFLVMAL